MKNTVLKKILQLLALIGLPLFSCAQKSAFEKAMLINNQDTLPYRILYPLDFDTTRQYPLILFLHGSGERGNDNEAQLRNGVDFFGSAENRKNFPAIVIVPQCPKEGYWSSVEITRLPDGERVFNFSDSENREITPALSQTVNLLEEFRQKSWVDNARIYVGGLSMGGMGTFELLARKPDWFAAAFIICGDGDPASAPKYAEKTPLWIFHGEVDDVIPVSRSIEMADAINKAGGNTLLTIYPNVGHDSWTPAFNEPELLTWLFAQRKAAGQ